MANITLVEQQQKAVDAVTDLASTPSTIVLRGHAGTGKTVTLSESARVASNVGKVVALAPTAAALSVIKNKLSAAGVSIAAAETVASVTSMPIDVLSLGKSGPKFKMNPEGLSQLGKLLSRLNVSADGVFSAVSEKTGVRRALDVTEDCTLYGEFVSCKTSLLKSTLNKRVGRAQFEPKEDSEMMLIQPDEVAQRLKAKAGAWKRDDAISAVIVDEASMVNDELTSLLKRAVVNELNTLLVVCGDPGQLQPVEGETSKLLSMTESNGAVEVVTLTEILRSTDSIAELAQSIRGGVTPSKMRMSRDERVTFSDESTPESVFAENIEVFDEADVVVTFRNKSVDAFNKLMRERRGFSGSVSKGDRIVCNANTYNTESAFSNGELLDVVEVSDVSENDYGFQMLSKLAAYRNGSEFDQIVTLMSAGRIKKALLRNIDGEAKEAFVFATVRPSVDFSTYRSMKRVIEKSECEVPILDASFGYALTVHKSQGSEWNSVAYVTSKRDEHLMPGPSMPYTAVTRAREKVAIIVTKM